MTEDGMAVSFGTQLMLSRFNNIKSELTIYLR